MRKDFDSLWDTPNVTPCPLSDAQMAAMIHYAQQHTPSPALPTLPSTTPRRPFRQLVAPLAVAASLALLIIPLTINRMHAAVPHAVDYEGQHVKIVCNNQCEADIIIQSLDTFIQQS